MTISPNIEYLRDILCKRQVNILPPRRVFCPKRRYYKYLTFSKEYRLFKVFVYSFFLKFSPKISPLLRKKFRVSTLRMRWLIALLNLSDFSCKIHRIHPIDQSIKRRKRFYAWFVDEICLRWTFLQRKI